MSTQKTLRIPKSELLATNLPQLQNLIRRDPLSYADEFAMQHNHYTAKLEIFKLKPDEDSPDFEHLIQFIAHVSTCYPSQTTDFPAQIMNLLESHHSLMSPSLRKCMVQALMLLRNRGVLTTAQILPLFFTLFKCRDKQLRQLLRTHIVNDIKAANLKHKNNKLNKTLQNFMYTMFEQGDIAAQKSLEVMIELYRKGVWNDQKTVNVIAEACFSKSGKVVGTAINFFLGNDTLQLDDDIDEDLPDLHSLQHQNSINKKTKSRKQAYLKTLSTLKKKSRKTNASAATFSALHLLNDPQGFADRLFTRLKSSSSSTTIRFPLRLTIMNLISRLIHTHKLILVQFYEFLVPYLQPQQRDVVQILAFAAQATHELTPPEEVQKVVEVIADRFVWSNCATEVVVAGLNGIREICVRSPLAMPQTLLQSLIDDYKNHKQKGAMNAARALLSVYREVNPEMLKKKDRGKNATINMKTFVAPKYAEFNVSTGVEGSELLGLVQSKKSKSEKQDDEEEVPELDKEDDEEWDDDDDDEEEVGNEGWEGWEIDSEGGVSEEEGGEWVDNKNESDDGSEDQEEETEKEQQQQQQQEQEQPTRRIEMERILTDEEFKKIRVLKMKHEIDRLTGTERKKRLQEVALQQQQQNDDADDQDDDDDDEDDDEESEFIDPRTLLKGIKRKREEIEKEASEPKQKYGSKKGKTERSSITNKVKSKKSKAVMMMVHKRSVKGKARRSLKDKSKALREHVKRQKMKK